MAQNAEKASPAHSAWLFGAVACLLAGGYVLAVSRLGAGAAGVLILVPLCYDGTLLADACGLRTSVWRTTAGVVLGTAYLALFTVLASLTHFGSLVWLAVLGLAAAGIAVHIKAKLPMAQPFTASENAWLLLGVMAFLCAAYYFAGAAPLVHPTVAGAVTPSQDFYWNVGNAESFLLGFPPADLRFAGVTVTYHYLTELLAAGLCMASGVSCYDWLAFYLPPFILCLLVPVAWEVGARLFANVNKQKLLLLFLFGTASAGLYKVLVNGADPFLNSFLTHLITNINSMGTGVLFLLAFTGLFFTQVEYGFSSLRVACLGALALLLLTLAKGPVAGIAVIAAVCTLVLCALRKNAPRKKLLLFAVALGAGFALVYGLLFSAGAGSSMVFSLTGTLEKSYFANYLARFAAENRTLYALCVPLFILAQSALFAPAVFFVWAAAAVHDVRRLGTVPPWRLFCHAVAVGGFAAFYLFDHANLSQIYFAFAAVAAMSLLAADTLPALWQTAKEKKVFGVLARVFLAGCVAVGMATAACTYAGFVQNGTQKLLHGQQDALAHETRTPLTVAEEEAMGWLRQNLPEDALFATNRIHTGAALEGLSNVYTGLSGRRSYMESFKYAMSNMGVSAEEAARRVAVLETVFGATPTAQVQRVCKEENIAMLVFCKNAAGEWQQPNLPVLYENNDVVILACTENVQG